MNQLTSIIIPVRDQLKYFKQCYLFVRKKTYADREIIIVNDGSGPETTDYINGLKHIKLVHNKESQGYPKACNQGIGIAKGDYICLLNSDTVVSARWLERLLDGPKNFPNAGIFGPSCNYGSFQKVPEAIGIKVDEIDKAAGKIYKKYRNIYERSIIIGFCYLVRARLFKELGLLDERFGMGQGEDKEFVWRAFKAGWKSIWVKQSFVYHYGHKSFGNVVNLKELGHKNRQLFYQITGIDNAYWYKEVAGNDY